MMELTCLGCGYEGRVSEYYAGLRVTCKRCRTENLVPESVTREIEAVDWIAAVDTSNEGATDEIDTRV